MKTLETLSQQDFIGLKNIGMLYEFFPDAPQNWYDTPQGRKAYESAFGKQKSRDKSKKAHEDLMPQIREWIKDGLKSGMWVKMAGCRDGKGIREVLEVIYNPIPIPYSESGTYRDRDEPIEAYTIECRQIFRYLAYNENKTGRPVYEERKGAITTHMDSKIREVFIDGKWTKIKDLVDKIPDGDCTISGTLKAFDILVKNIKL